MADKDPFAQYVAPEAEAGGDPFAQYVEAEPAAPAKRSFLGEAAHRVAEAGHSFAENVKNIPSTSGARIWENAKALAQPFKQAGQAVADEVTHPLRTLQGSPAAQLLGLSTPEAVRHHEAVGNEFERGLQSTIPLAGLAHERFTGFPEASPEDAAEAPYARGAGAVTGLAALPLAGKTAGVARDAAVAGAEAAGGAVRKLGEAAIERSTARGATPIWDAVKEGGGDLLHGHVIKPAVRVGATAADELGAALARKMLRKPAPLTPEYVPPEAPAAAGPVTTDVTPPKLLESAPIEMGPITPEAPVPAEAPVSGHASTNPPPAPAPAPVADVEAISKVAVPPSKPAWEPGRGDAEFARKLGMSTEKYRDMMAKRTARLTAKEVENIKVAKLVRLVTEGHSSKSVAAAADEAISAGADPSVIQRITTKMVAGAARKAVNAD